MNSKLLYWDLPLLFTWTRVEKSPQLLGKNFVFFSKETFWQTRQDSGESPGERGKQKLTYRDIFGSPAKAVRIIFFGPKKRLWENFPKVSKAVRIIFFWTNNDLGKKDDS